MQKLKKVLLIDDDKISNFLSTRLLNSQKIFEEIIVKLNGNLALDYLKNCQSEKIAFPEIIFLDHHMPVMDGEEFMIKFKELVMVNEIRTIIILLGANLNERDVKAFKNLGVHEVASKPLSKEFVMMAYHTFLARYFLLNHG